MAARSARRFAIFALGMSIGGCKADRRADVEGVERARPSGPSERATEGDGGGRLVLAPAIPEDFPTTLPVYPGSRVTLGRGRTIALGKRAWSLTVETGDPKDQVRAYYGGHLPGYALTSDVDLGDSALSVWRSEVYDLYLLLGKGADGKTTVTLDVAER